MNTRDHFELRLGLLAVLSAVLVTTACAPTPPPTPFIPPRAATATLPLVEENTPVIPTNTPQPANTASPTATPPCSDGLDFVEDVTIPDGTVVSPGASIDKQWRVQNNGTCNWDARYRLRFAGGLDMGAASEQALFPARAGSQAIIRMAFTAPSEPGNYSTSWQAFNPKGEPFGEPVFMAIVVQPEAGLTFEVTQDAQ
jgi:hypothetical protein